MNKFLIVLLAVILVSASAFRVKSKAKHDDDAHWLRDACNECGHHDEHDVSRIQHDEFCESIHEVCQDLAEDNEDDDDDEDDDDEDDDDEDDDDEDDDDEDDDDDDDDEDDE